MWDDLSPKQSKTLEFIISYYKKNSYSPTYQEIAKNQKINIKSVSQRLEQLKKKGYIDIKRNIPRGIVLTQKVGLNVCKTISVNIYRRIEKYKRHFKLKEFERSIVISSDMFQGIQSESKEDRVFILRLQEGFQFDNYLDIGIDYEDMLVIFRSNELNENDKVVSIYEGKLIIGVVSRVDKFYTIQLKKGFIPIGGSNALIVGKLVSVIKKV
ncbi:MAG: hypothetical protein N2712_03725 [Brevinematales bacterium]|nr:hypothetical protein [Brevinematales bacterium]